MPDSVLKRTSRLIALVLRHKPEVAGLTLDPAGWVQVGAQQGHSVVVDLGLQAAPPPPKLYHGTIPGALDAILAEGLSKMQRHHLHLSPDVETATKVGARRGKPVVLEVDAAAMAADGHVFFRSANGVWLTDAVPLHYLRRHR
jgi:putative RNA 2'-phosphotransferase